MACLQDWTFNLAKKILPAGLRNWLVQKRRQFKLHSTIDFGDFARTTPISRVFGFDRGMAIDRYYIEKFLAANSHHIQGRALEMGDPFYINKFGDGKVKQIDVMHVVEGNPEATIIADLTAADHLPCDQFDCIIFTQSLQMIYDLKTALRTLHRILKPGGKLLMTSAGISKIARRLGKDDWGEYWHLTSQSAEALIAETFPGGECEVATMGNVLSAMCFLHGMAAAELPSDKLDICDPDFEVLITVVATKSTATQ
ncbi:MAG: methyltransferase domain-containing protein [Pseudomonadales bacterium]